MKVTIGPHTLERIHAYQQHAEGNVTASGDVFVFTMNNGENAFNTTSIAQYNEMLDIVERSASIHAALVVTGQDKFWCTGLDLPLLKTLPSKDFVETVNQFQLFLARFITLPCMTVAAINGHCFGGGAMWSLAHDYRVMRDDRGFWTTLQPYPLLRDCVMTGKRFVASEAKELRIVDEAVPQVQVVPRGVAVALEVSKKDRRAVGVLKSTVHRVTAELLREGMRGNDIHSIFPNL